MITRRPLAAGQTGFTLVEVLIALVILAVGLLALEGLGVYAVRAVAQADRNSRAATVATLYLEDALQQIRTDRRPPSCPSTVLPNGDRVDRTVFPSTSFPVPWRVTVTVTPASRGRVEQPYTVTGYAYVPRLLTAGGNACP